MSQHATTLTIELNQGLGDRLEEVAEATSRSKAWLAQEALRSFLDLYEWQVQAIREGMADADAGRLADHDEVAAWLGSWGTDRELPPPRCD